MPLLLLRKSFTLLLVSCGTSSSLLHHHPHAVFSLIRRTQYHSSLHHRHVPSTTRNTAQQQQQQQQLSALIPLSPEETHQLVSLGAPTGAQYATYWGRTPQERYGRVLESALVSFLGMFFSYFLSFVVGAFMATCLGALFLFWGILSPELQAYQRNWEFLGGRPLVEAVVSTVRRDDNDDNNKAGLYSALFVGHLRDVCVVQDAADETEYDLADFADDYQMERDELEQWTGQPYLIRVRLADRAGRQLQVHARLSEEYAKTTTIITTLVGLPVAAILLSTRPSFAQLAALTDLYVPDVDLWIGDYPYLNRAEMENLIATDDDIWEALQQEAVVVDDDNDDVSSDDDTDEWTRERDSNNDDDPMSEKKSSSATRSEAVRSVVMENDDEVLLDYSDAATAQQDEFVPVRRRRRRRPM